MVIRLLVALLLSAGAARADSLRLMVPEAAPVVGEMIPVTVRGEYTSFITLEKLTFPNSPDYDWMQTARDAWRDEMVEGRTVKVFERRIALFPRRAGTLAIGPLTHHLTILGKSSPREALDVAAPPVTLTVAPYPAEGVPLSARSLTVDDRLSADPGSLRDGDTLIRRVVIKADGTLAHLLPPRPSLREPWLISFVSPEQRTVLPTPDGPAVTVIWEWSLRPKTGEPGVLPAFSFAWFDTVSRQMKAAEIPAIPFGYASFRDNQGGADRLAPGQFALGAGAVAFGLAAGLGLALQGAAARGLGEIRRSFARLSPVDPTRRALRKAARTGDLLALRAAAERYLARRRALGRTVTGRETAALDALLYGRDAAGTVDAAALAKGITTHRPQR